jgi:hypothetical protein
MLRAGVLSRGIEIYKVGNHGSKSSTAAHLLSQTASQIAVISAGRTNEYGGRSRPGGRQQARCFWIDGLADRRLIWRRHGNRSLRLRDHVKFAAATGAESIDRRPQTLEDPNSDAYTGPASVGPTVSSVALGEVFVVGDRLRESLDPRQRCR